MFTDLNVFYMAHAMAVHAGQRQGVIAQNLANADTPGYQARDIEPFAQLVAKHGTGAGMRSNRAGHMNGPAGGSAGWPLLTPEAPADPNKNTVSLEQEMLKSVEVKRQHDRALAIYKSSLNILRTSVGRG